MLRGPYSRNSVAVIMVGITLGMAPVLPAFLVLQQRMLESIGFTGGIKQTPFRMPSRLILEHAYAGDPPDSGPPVAGWLEARKRIALDTGGLSEIAMSMPIRLANVHIDERTYVRFTAALIWSEALRLAVQALFLTASGLPVWWVLRNSGHVPVAALLAWLLPVPLWMAFSYPVGRAATGRATPWLDVLRTFFTRYPQALFTSLPLVLALNLWVAAANLQGSNPPLFVTAGIFANLGVTLVLAVVTLHALTVQVLFDLPVRRSLQYGLALTLRWPIVSFGLLALTWLLTLGARLAGGAAWLLIPALLQPFAVTATLLLCLRGQRLEAEAGGGA